MHLISSRFRNSTSCLQITASASIFRWSGLMWIECFHHGYIILWEQVRWWRTELYLKTWPNVLLRVSLTLITRLVALMIWLMESWPDQKSFVEIIEDLSIDRELWFLFVGFCGEEPGKAAFFPDWNIRQMANRNMRNTAPSHQISDVKCESVQSFSTFIVSFSCKIKLPYTLVHTHLKIRRFVSDAHVSHDKTIAQRIDRMIFKP